MGVISRRAAAQTYLHNMYFPIAASLHHHLLLLVLLLLRAAPPEIRIAAVISRARLVAFRALVLRRIGDASLRMARV